MRKLWFGNKQLAQSHSRSNWQSQDLNPDVADVHVLNHNQAWNNWLKGEHSRKEDTPKKKVNQLLEHPNSLMLFLYVKKLAFFLMSLLYFIRKNNPDVRSN